ncbi:hypothetical protein OKW29_006417 [Paraburkholderia sp. CI3]
MADESARAGHSGDIRAYDFTHMFSDIARDFGQRVML